jgi:hypothetical protein
MKRTTLLVEETVGNLTPADLARCAQLLGEYDFLGLVDV